MAKKTTKRKSMRSARKVARKASPVYRINTAFKQPINFLQNGFTSIMSYFK